MDKKTLGLLGFMAVFIFLGVMIGGSGRGGSAINQTAGGPNSQVYCSDSDGGNNVAVQGTTRTYTQKPNGNQTTVASSTDSCSGTTNVVEYFCGGSTIANSNISCGTNSSCVNGACVVNPTNCVISSFGANPSSVAQTNSGTSLSWTTSNCSGTNITWTDANSGSGSLGAVPASGTINTQTLVSGTTFTLSGVDSNGSPASSNVQVGVTADCVLDNTCGGGSY